MGTKLDELFEENSLVHRYLDDTVLGLFPYVSCIVLARVAPSVQNAVPYHSA